MQFRNQGEPTTPAYFRNMSGLLLAFVVLSALAHGLTFLFSPETALPFNEQRFGATIISTVLTPAKDKPATPSSQRKTPVAQEKKPANNNQQLTAEAENTSKKVSAIAIAEKTELKTNSDTKPETSSETKQAESQASPQRESITTTSANKTTSPASESLAIQLQQQRNYLLGELQNRLNRFLTYPVRARRRGWQGEVMVAFNINKHGQLNNVRLARSSGYSLLDRSAVNAISKLKHIDLPGSMGRLQAMDLQLPVRYELRES